MFKRILEQNNCPPLQLVSKLHITIARRLNEWVYNKAILEYKEQTFSELFTLTKLTLFKRDSRYSKGKSWRLLLASGKNTV